MDTQLEQIRQNLVSASAHLERIYPAAPPELRLAVMQAWDRYAILTARQEISAPRPGKNMGFLPLLIVGVVGLSAIMGGTAYITHELNESERLNKIAECIEENTKKGTSLQSAQEACNKLYGKTGGGPLVSVGGFDISPFLLLGGLGVLGFVLLKKI